MSEEGGKKISVFVHGQGITTVYAGGWGVKKLQTSVYVVVECSQCKRKMQKPDERTLILPE